MPGSVLAIAVASGRIGYVYLSGGTLQDWAVSTSVSGKSSDLVAHVQTLINDLKPDVLVTEQCDAACRKGKRSRALIASVAELASHNYLLVISVPRPRDYPSKYEEAQSIVKRHPVLTGYLPARKRRIFDFEPRNRCQQAKFSFPLQNY